jgi:hypothetical protein
MKLRGKVMTMAGQNVTTVEYTLSGHTRRIDAGTTVIPGMTSLQLTVKPIPLWASLGEEMLLETEDGRRLRFWFCDSDDNITVGGWTE